MENWEDGWKRLLDEALRRLNNEKERIQNSAGNRGNEGEQKQGRNGGMRPDMSSRIYGEEPIRQRKSNTAGTQESRNSDSLNNSKVKADGRPQFRTSAKTRGQGKLPGKLNELYEMIRKESNPNTNPFMDFDVAWNPLYSWNLYDESYHFYKQALFMVDYEDNEPYKGEIGNIFWPTYQKLDTAQLRGYFTWRVSVRRVYEAYRSYVGAQEIWSDKEAAHEGRRNDEAAYEGQRSSETNRESCRGSEIVKEDRQGYEAEQKSRRDAEVEKNDMKGLPQARVIAEAPLCYQYIYVYEVLNQVGVESAEDGYYRLKFFEWALDGKNGGIMLHLREWMQDYVIYYQLDRELLADSKCVKEDNALLILLDMEEHTPGEVYDAAVCMSAYKAGASKYIRENLGQYQDTLYRVLSKMVAYYEKNRKNGFWDSLFGVSTRYPVKLFEGAVFYDRYSYLEDYEESKPIDIRYKLDELRCYCCDRGKWICDGYYRLEKNLTLGQIMCAVDSELRDAYDYGHPLRNTLEIKYLNNMVRQEVNQHRKKEEAERKEKERIARQTEARLKREEAERLRQEELRRKEEERARIEKEREEEERRKREVVLDFSKLDEIRRAAEVTQQRLIVDGEDEKEQVVFDAQGKDVLDKYLCGDVQADADVQSCKDVQPDTEVHPGKDVPPDRDETESGCNGNMQGVASVENAREEGYVKEEEIKENGYGLNESEIFVLNALLNGGDYKEYFRNHRLMPSIVVESINEKLFDEIGDVVIEFDGDEPVLVEDYREDVEKLLL